MLLSLTRRRWCPRRVLASPCHRQQHRAGDGQQDYNLVLSGPVVPWTDRVALQGREQGNIMLPGIDGWSLRNEQSLVVSWGNGRYGIVYDQKNSNRRFGSFDSSRSRLLVGRVRAWVQRPSGAYE